MSEALADGAVELYLLAGDYEDRLVSIEVERAEVVSVLDMESGDILPLSAVGEEDRKRVIARINERI